MLESIFQPYATDERTKKVLLCTAEQKSFCVYLCDLEFIHIMGELNFVQFPYKNDVYLIREDQITVIKILATQKKDTV